MTAAERLPPPFGERIDREKPLSFRFEGREYIGFFGDTVASALIANDERLISRSFKYHRPRGALTMAGQDANTLVQLPSDPNALADRQPLTDGLHISGQNYSGSLARDRGAFVQRLSRFLPVGFYYKAFFRPRGIWELWAKLFRNKAGLGIIDQSFVPQGYDKQYLFCDVLVVGGGEAGLRSALHAAGEGAEVILVDENPALGGALNYARLDVDATRGRGLRDRLVEKVTAHAGIRVMTNAVANGWFADNWVAVISGSRMYKLRATEIFLCSGALEQIAVFRNNDLPGVMTCGAAGRLLHLYGVRPGAAAVILTCNDFGYGCALDLDDAGVTLRAVVDLRSACSASALRQAVAARGVRIMDGAAVYTAIDSGGRLSAVDIRAIVSDGVLASSGETIACDVLCMATGFMPTYQLACQAGARLTYDDDSAAFSLVDLPDGLHTAGAAAGALAGGNFGWPIFPHPAGREFVDLDEDLQIADILNATREGYEHIQLLKRFSTSGMGPSQGRHSALPAARLVARATGRTVADTGVTTARPPFAAEKIAHCAGRSFYPARRSNIHYRHLAAGAHMMQAGDWYRPAYYGGVADAARLIREEAQHVRRCAGIIDVSTLGGLEIRGPDAVEFVNRLYTGNFAKQANGRARYALMTNEAGVVIDDGVACRFSDEHFYMTATTGGVGRVFQSMLKWNAQWRLDVDVSNVSSAYCGVNIAGPHSRELLQQLCDDIDLAPAALPYMGVTTGRVADIPVRVLRVGFTGELGFEIHAPQHCGEALWDALIDSAAARGLRPFGVEAQRLLRLEKGHIIIGQDTDAMSHPAEIGMNWAVASDKPFFVGKRSIDELESRGVTRSLVGFEICERDAPLPKECHLVLDGDRMIGRVTSAARSPTLGKTIGLAYVPVGKANTGSLIDIRVDHGVIVQGTVVPVPFHDPDNRRQQP